MGTGNCEWADGALRSAAPRLRLAHALIVVAGAAGLGWFVNDLAGIPEMGRAILSPSLQAALPEWGLGVWLAVLVGWGVVSWPIAGFVLAKRRGVRLADGLCVSARWYAPLLLFWLAPVCYLSPKLVYFPYFLIPVAAGLAAGMKWGDLSDGCERPRLSHALMVAAIAVFVVVFGALNCLQVRANNVPFTDSGYFERMLWNMCHGNVLHACEHEYIFLGTRVRFIQFWIWPVYALCQRIETLTLLQVLAVGLGAGPIYLLSRRVLSDTRLALACGVAYLLHPGVQYLVSDASGEIVRLGTLGMPASLLALYWVERRRYGRASLAFAIALCCREEYALVAAAAGVYVLGSSMRGAGGGARRRDRRFGLAMLVVGLAWFFAALFVVIPAFSGGGFRGFQYYEHLGGSAGQVAHSLLSRPWRAAVYMFSVEKTGFMLHLLVPLLLLPLLSPGRLALAVPALAICLLNSKYQASSILFHYHAPVLPFVFFALPFGVKRFVRWRAEAGRRTGAAVSCGLIVAALVASVLVGKGPLSLSFWDPASPYHYRRMYVAQPAAAEARRLRQTIPRPSKVCASEFIATQFTHHAAVWTFPNRLADADVVVIDRNDRWLRRSEGALAALRDQVAGSGRWRLLSDRAGVLVYERRRR